MFGWPLHPYTHGLLQSVPRLGGQGERLSTISGMVPQLTALPSGCRFRDRCELAEAECARIDPVLEFVGAGHRVACIVAARDGGRS